MLLCAAALLPAFVLHGPGTGPGSLPLAGRCSSALQYERSALVFLSANKQKAQVEAKSDLEDAIIRVKKAATKFGKVQGAATDEWLDQAISLNPKAPRDKASLMSKQLILFEECLLDDEDGKCRELDAALTSFETNLGKAKGTFLDRTQFERAAARVRRAASKFGTEQKKNADEWIKTSRSEGTMDSAELVERQVALFGECMLDGDTRKCQELDAALTAFRVALGVEEQVDEQGMAELEPTSVATEPAPKETAKAAPKAAPAAAPSAARTESPAKSATPSTPSLVDEPLKKALRQATIGRDARSVSTLMLLERAIESAEAAGVDKEKLSVAREVVASRGKVPADASARFW